MPWLFRTKLILFRIWQKPSNFLLKRAHKTIRKLEKPEINVDVRKVDSLA